MKHIKTSRLPQPVRLEPVGPKFKNRLELNIETDLDFKNRSRSISDRVLHKVLVVIIFSKSILSFLYKQNKITLDLNNNILK